VNAALASLHSRPWEYWLLGAAPVPWREEDSVLVSYAMWWDLQYGGFERELVKRKINAKLAGADCAPQLEVRTAVFLSTEDDMGQSQWDHSCGEILRRLR
jgi:acyl-homoserine lactone acylase PvdQ